MTTTILNFCDTPSIELYKLMDENVQEFIYQVANYCVNTDNGDIELSKKIINYYYVRNLSADAFRSLKAVLLAVKHLRDISEKIENNYTMYPKLIIYDDSNVKLWQIAYGAEEGFEEQFKIIPYGYFEINAEYLYFYDDAKDYLVERIGSNNVTVGKITLQLSNKEKIENYYLIKYGIVYQENQTCVNCFEFFNAIGINCVEGKCDKNSLRKILLLTHPDKIRNLTVDDKKQLFSITDTYSKLFPTKKIKPTEVIKYIIKCNKLLSDNCLDDLHHGPKSV